MPILTTKYASLEAIVVPIFLKAINAPNGDTSIILDDNQISITLLNSTDADLLFEKLQPAFTELFVESNIPITLGEEAYVSRNKYNKCSININISLIDLDRFLENESLMYQQQKPHNGALYRKVNPRGLNRSIANYIISAIKNTIFQEDGYPAASVNQNKSFCLVCEADGSDHSSNNSANAFYNFHLLFEELCKKHGLQLLPNATKYSTATVISSAPKLIKYEFNIDPADLEQLLLAESEYYAGYRAGASINRLVDPSCMDIKDGVICLFPAFSLSENEYIPRTAGCNMSEMISVQLANYVKKYMLSDSEQDKKFFFGHHSSKLTEDALGIDKEVILLALAKCLSINGRFNHQSEDGTRILSTSNTPLVQICDMDESAQGIYQRLAPITHVELEQLQSCEIPIKVFLNLLDEAVRERIIFLSAQEQKSDLTKTKINDLEQSFIKIHQLSQKISPKFSASY